MRSGKALLVLAEGELHVFQAAMRKCCNKTVKDTHGFPERIKELAHPCVIDLNFLPRRDFDATGGKTREKRELVDADEPFEGTVADTAGQICVTLTDHDESALGFQGDLIFFNWVDESADLIQVWQETGLSLSLAANGAMQLALKKPQDLLLIRKRFLRGKPTSKSKPSVTSDSVAIVARGSGYVFDGLTIMPSADDIPHVHDACDSICHVFSPVVVGTR